MGRSNSRAWRRQGRDANMEQSVLEELLRRRLETIDQCRLAWEEADNPVAVAVAITKVEGVPEWLADAIILLLCDSDRDSRRLVSAHRQHLNDAVDAARALEIAAARTDPNGPLTWRDAGNAANKLVARSAGEERGFSDIPTVSADAIRKSFERVRNGLADPGRYWAPVGLDERRKEAMKRELARLRTKLEHALPQDSNT